MIGPSAAGEGPELDREGFARGRRARRRGAGRADHPEPHRNHPGAGGAQDSGRSVREIDDASLDERPAVVDADLDDLPVVDVGDHDARAERQRPMGGGEVAHVVHLPAGRSPAVMGTAVPRREAGLLAADHGRAPRAGHHGARAPGQREQAHRRQSGPTRRASAHRPPSSHRSTRPGKGPRRLPRRAGRPGHGGQGRMAVA